MRQRDTLGAAPSGIPLELALPSLHQIKERKVVQWGLAYLAGAWLVLQVVVALGSVYGWPTWLMRTIPVLLVTGFLGALVLAWFHGEQGRQRVSGVEFVLLIGVLALAGGGVAVLAPSDQNPPLEALNDVDLNNLHDEQALELAYEWGIGGNIKASMAVLEHLVERVDSDSAKMSYLATGASLLSREGRQEDAVTWMLELMAIDPVSLTLASDAGPEITRGYLEALRRHYAARVQPSPVRTIAVLPQGAYMVGFPDSLSGVRTELAEALPTLLQVEMAPAMRLAGIDVVERQDVAAIERWKHAPLPIGEVRVGLPGSDWLWVDEGSMPEGLLRASHYVLCYCTYLGEPFESGGIGSMTCSAQLISTEGSGIRASAQSRGDIADWYALFTDVSARLAKQITS